MKWFVILFLIIAIGAGGFYYSKKKGANAAVVPVTLATVAKGNIQKSVPCTGKVVSNLDVDIKCRSSGEVIKLPLDVSQEVKKGDLLLELDPVDSERMVKLRSVVVKSSQARLESAKQNLITAEKAVDTSRQRADTAKESAGIRLTVVKAKAERRKQLVAEGLGSAEDYEAVKNEVAQAEADYKNTLVQLEEIKTQELALEVKRQDVKLAEAQLEQDRLSLADYEQQLEYCKVFAPMDGTITARNVQIGMIIASGINNIGGGTTVLTLSDLSHIYVLASVDESDIANVDVGQKVVVEADAHKNEKFIGKVVRIAAKGTTTSNVVTFEVKIEIVSDNKNKLKPEMTTNVEIISAEKNDILIIPDTAIIKRGGESFVTPAGADGKPAAEKTVVLGLSNGEHSEVLSGLAENDKVVVTNDVSGKWTAPQRGGPPM